MLFIAPSFALLSLTPGPQLVLRTNHRGKCIREDKQKRRIFIFFSHMREGTKRRRPESAIKGGVGGGGGVSEEAEKGPKGTGFHVSDKCNHKSPALPVNNHLNQPAAVDATG